MSAKEEEVWDRICAEIYRVLQQRRNVTKCIFLLLLQDKGVLMQRKSFYGGVHHFFSLLTELAVVKIRLLAKY